MRLSFRLPPRASDTYFPPNFAQKSVASVLGRAVRRDASAKVFRGKIKIFLFPLKKGERREGKGNKESKELCLAYFFSALAAFSRTAFQTYETKKIVFLLLSNISFFPAEHTIQERTAAFLNYAWK